MPPMSIGLSNSAAERAKRSAAPLVSAQLKPVARHAGAVQAKPVAHFNGSAEGGTRTDGFEEVDLRTGTGGGGGGTEWVLDHDGFGEGGDTERLSWEDARRHDSHRYHDGARNGRDNGQDGHDSHGGRRDGRYHGWNDGLREGRQVARARGAEAADQIDDDWSGSADVNLYAADAYASDQPGPSHGQVGRSDFNDFSANGGDARGGSEGSGGSGGVGAVGNGGAGVWASTSPATSMARSPTARSLSGRSNASSNRIRPGNGRAICKWERGAAPAALGIGGVKVGSMDVGHPMDYLDHRQYDQCDQHHKRDEYRGRDGGGDGGGDGDDGMDEQTHHLDERGE